MLDTPLFGEFMPADAPKPDSAEEIKAEGSLPLGRFLVREARKLLVPVLTAALAGGGTAFVGWNLQGRGQARDDATEAAQKQVLLLEELKAYLKEQKIGSVSAVRTDTAALIEDFRATLKRRGRDPAEFGEHLRDTVETAQRAVYVLEDQADDPVVEEAPAPQ